MELTTALGWLAAVLLAVGLVLVGYLWRIRLLSQRPGTFWCQVRVGAGRWSPGVARYGAARMVWWSMLSLSPRPELAWSRARLELVDRVVGDHTDHDGVPLVRARVRHEGAELELSMSPEAYTGLVSWIEAGPRPVGRER